MCVYTSAFARLLPTPASNIQGTEFLETGEDWELSFKMSFEIHCCQQPVFLMLCWGIRSRRM